MHSLKVNTADHSRLCKTFAKYLNNLIKVHFQVHTAPNGTDSLGRAIYDDKKFTQHSVAYIFQLKMKEWETKKTHIAFKEFQQLIKHQITLFPTSKEFDYTQTVGETMELDKYFGPQLVQIISSITRSTNATRNKCSALYEDLRTSRIRMTIAALCFAMNPLCCFIQTLNGLMCYAYGLRDKGFYLLHMPPPPSVATYLDYFHLLWQQTVKKYVLRHQSLYLYIIIDKPDFLPPPRTIVHTSRANKSKSSQDTIVSPEVTDESQIPHGKCYSAILANCTQFKVKLIEYVTSKFQAQAMHSTRQRHFSLILDSPSIQTVSTIRNGTLHNSQSNQHGEAEYAILHHCIQTPSNNVLIVSSDTDTWVYGLGVYESGQLSGKQVYVQRGNTDSFIHINKATTLIRNHPILSKISYPVLSLVALYTYSQVVIMSAHFTGVPRPSFWRHSSTT